MFSVSYITDEIIFLNFKNREVMCKTLLRFQEYFESPYFRQKIFTLDEFKKWYMTSRKAMTFTYYEDWGGFNFPSWAVEPFFDGRFKNLSKEEKKILNILKPFRGRKFYVIASSGNGEASAFRHEFAHASYYLYPSYKTIVDELLRDLKVKEYIMQGIKEMGYHDVVLLDELHAYLIEGVDYVWELFSLEEVLHPKLKKEYEAVSTLLNLLLDRQLRLNEKKTAT